MFVCVFLLLCLLGFGDRLMVNFWFGITQNCLTVLKVRKQNRSHWIKLRSFQSKALRKKKLFLADKGPKSLFFFPPASRIWHTRSSILAWRIPRTEGPGGLLSMGSNRVGHN